MDVFLHNYLQVATYPYPNIKKLIFAFYKIES